jgi:HEAT repeat protein
MAFAALSQASIEKLERLRNREGFLGRFFQSTEEKAAILTSLGDTGEVALLPPLLAYVCDNEVPVRDAAKLALARLLACVSVDRLIELDEFMRAETDPWAWWQEESRRVKPPQVEELTAPNELDALGLLSMHSNGYVREAAVRKLAGKTDGAELPFLLVRINDWAKPVRERARVAVSARMRESYAVQVLRCMPLILRVRHGERDDHRWLMEAVAKLLSQTECADVLHAGIQSKDRTLRVACMRLAVDANSSVASKALETALSDSDSMVRFWASRHMLSTLSAEKIPALCRRLIEDPFMPVRREALSALVKPGDDSARLALESALLDRHASIREFARFHLRGKVDVVAIYREAVSSATGRKLATAIRGLGESGTGVDAVVIAPFLRSPVVMLRKAAIVAVGRLAPKEMLGDLLDALADSSPRVAREAMGILREHAGHVADEALSFLKEHPESSVRRHALALVCLLGKWMQLPAILAACRDASPEVSLAAAHAIRTWLSNCNRSYVSPSKAQLSDAERELRASRNLLPAKVVVELESLLAEWKQR